MRATTRLHDLGQSIWLDNITRDLLDSGTLRRYVDDLSVTGLTSNPTIFNQAIKGSAAYDADVAAGLAKGRSGESLFFDLAIEDITRAADLFKPILGPDQHRRRLGVVRGLASPRLRHGQHAGGGERTVRPREAPQPLHQDPRHDRRAAGHRGGDSSRASRSTSRSSSRASSITSRRPTRYLRGIERRVEAGLDPNVGSVASVFISRWDGAVAGCGRGAPRPQWACTGSRSLR